MFRYILLGLLRAGAAQHGYGLIKAYRGRSGLDVNSGTVYRELRRLQAENLIRATASPVGRRPRTSYEITEAGDVAFGTWLRRVAFQATRKYDNTLVHKALFLSSAGEPQALRLLRAWQNELWFGSKVVERARREAVEEAKAHPGSFSPLPLLLARRLRYLNAESEFLGAVEAAYKRWRAKSSRAGTRKRRKVGRGQVRQQQSVRKRALGSVATTTTVRKRPGRRRSRAPANPVRSKT